jgi:hypothetical protein
MADRTQSERDAAEMHGKLLELQEQAYSFGWHDVAVAADRSQCALRRRLHPDDLAVVDNA